ncbi:MAG: FAD:protein FMN transferase [Desulfuromonadaceae bacterium]|nr:FAD:protein FMN transferase [Desulfuromonadaceae bacterium]MDD5106215.1 FAD:protein FMN transferase [Desulfuromonadaceae bacterium]
MNRKTGLLFVAILLIGGLATLQYFRRSYEYSSDQFLMDTLVSIKAYGKDPSTVKRAVAAAYAEMHRIAELADGFPQPGTATYRSSDVCRINEQAGKKPVRVDADIMAMLLLAKKYNQMSDGAFDVTIGPVMDLWGFGDKNPHVPSQEQIRSALTLVNSNDLMIDEQQHTVFLRRAGMKLDLGALAKGYATEKAIQALKKNGIRKALLDAGGSIRVLGVNLRNAPWRIGIKDPRKADAIVAVLPLQDASAVTSGDYYRYFEAGGKRYHHILDPRTGYPATSNMSVTVVTQDAGLADILSTVFFILSPDKALEMARKMAGVELFMITADGHIRHTPPLLSGIEVKAGESYLYDQGR